MAPTPKHPEPKDLLVRADRAAAQEESFRHPLNPASEIHGTTLSRLTGLVKCGVNLIRVPTGKESFVHHVHLVDEEWMYVISGARGAAHRRRALPGGPGRLRRLPAAHPRPPPANTGAGDLVYLSGGEAVDFGIADFPDLGLRMTIAGKEAKVYPLAEGKDLFGK